LSLFDFHKKRAKIHLKSQIYFKKGRDKGFKTEHTLQIIFLWSAFFIENEGVKI